ncbi:hypothetical protein ACIQZO_35095 [Streptomyces sp. NPDC097617]|uniref:hypothetical protein n=1 Tax=Streptomyces sp. NPDC097617 TaxID=3366091 RepID=UPI0038224643
MNQQTSTAQRARLLAGIIRGRAVGHPDAKALRLIARQLGQASAVLRGLDGDHDIADRAEAILWRARMAAPESFPPVVIGYVSAPLAGYLPGLDDLMPANPEHVRSEHTLRARLLDVLGTGLLGSSDDQEATAALVGLLDVHTAHAALAAEVEIHGRADAYPTVYRPHTGSRAAQHLPGRLTVFDGGQVLAELNVPYGITPGEVWQLIRDIEPARPLIAA